MRRRFFNSRINNKIIIYTSSDNLIVVPFRYDFGAIIISNTINNNVGKITFNRDVAIIGVSAFSNRHNLTSIEIPDSVTSIGWEAFYECYSLTSVYVKATTPPTLGTKVFDNNASDRKIYVPRTSLNAYKTASGWSDYASAIEPYDFNGGGQFYVHCEGGLDNDTYTFTIDSQKTWEECVGLKDDTGVAEISSYEEVVPGSGMYRFHIHVDPFWYAVESDEDYNVPTPGDKIKINTTYEAFEV